jgi:hypothetical protein
MHSVNATATEWQTSEAMMQGLTIITIVVNDTVYWLIAYWLIDLLIVLQNSRANRMCLQPRSGQMHEEENRWKFDKLYSGDEFGEFTPHVLVNVDSMSLLWLDALESSVPILKPHAWNVVAPALAEKHTLLVIAEEMTLARISGFTSCNCHHVSVISETGMKVGLSMDCSQWALAVMLSCQLTLIWNMMVNSKNDCDESSTLKSIGWAIYGFLSHRTWSLFIWVACDSRKPLKIFWFETRAFLNG